MTGAAESVGGCAVKGGELLSGPLGGAAATSVGGGDDVVSKVDGADGGGTAAVPSMPSAWAVGTRSIAPRRKILGLPSANAPGLPATKIDIICGTLIVVEGRTRLAIPDKVSPDLTGP